MTASNSFAGKKLLVKSEFEEYIHQTLSSGQGVGLALGVVQDGKLVYSKGFGYRDFEKKLPVTPQTVFMTASVTKSFTSVLAGILVDRKKLEWDQPVVQVIPEFSMVYSDSTKGVTLAHLLHHQTGLARHDYVWILNSEFQQRDLLSEISYLEAVPQFGKTFLYNNLMYAVAGIMEEKAGGASWGQLIQNEIFTPLKMTSSSVGRARFLANPDSAVPYTLNHQKARTISTQDEIQAACAVNSTIEDLSRYAIFHLNYGKGLLTEQSFQRIHQKVALIDKDEPLYERFSQAFPQQDVYYQMGWFEAQRHGEKIFEHTGGVRGFSSHLLLMPEKKMAVIVLANSDHYPTPFITYDLLDHVLGLPAEKLTQRVIDKVYKKPTEDLEEKKRDYLKKFLNPSEIDSLVGTYAHVGFKPLFKIQKRKTSKSSESPLEWLVLDQKLELVPIGEHQWKVWSDDLLYRHVLLKWDTEKNGFYLNPILERASAPMAFFKKI